MKETTPSGAPAGRQRFWIAVACFALCNALAWVAFHRLSRPHMPALLKVERFAPGENAVVGVRPSLTWHFNLDVARRGDEANPPGRITPAVAGKWLWDDARTLEFVPDTSLPAATAVRFEILPERLSTADGFALAAPFISTVRSLPLDVLAVSRVGSHQDRHTLQIEFSDRVLGPEAASRIHIDDRKGNPVGFKLEGETAGKVVRLTTDPIVLPSSGDDAQLIVHIDAGLAGASGALGLQQARDFTVQIGRALIATGINASNDAFAHASLTLSFNNVVDSRRLKTVVSVEPKVDFEVVGAGARVRLRGAFKSSTRYSVTIAAPPAGDDPVLYPKPGTLSAFVPRKSPGLWFEHNMGYLSTGGNRAVSAKVVNCFDFEVSLQRIYDSNLVGWQNAPLGYWGDSGRYSAPVATRRISVPRVQDVVQELRITIDDLLGPAAATTDGAYRVTVRPVRSAGKAESNEWVGSAECVVTLSDIGLTAKLAEGQLTAWAVSLTNGKPLADVLVRLFSSKNQLLGQARTTRDGLAVIKGFTPAPGEHPAILLAEQPVGPSAAPAGGWIASIDEGFIPSTLRPPTTQPAPSRNLTMLNLAQAWQLREADVAGAPYLRDGAEAFIFTERGVYRPGETVHLRALVRGARNLPIGKAFPVEWRIRRPDHRNWRSAEMMLPADGALAFDVELPADLTPGRWSVELGLPGGADKAKPAAGDGDEEDNSTRPAGAHATFGEKAFLVEDYVPARLKVEVRLGGAPLDQDDRRIAVTDERLDVRVKGDYLFGQPAAACNASLVARLDARGFAPAQWRGWTFSDAAGTAPLLHPDASSKGASRAITDLANQTADEAGESAWQIDLKRETGLPGRSAPANDQSHYLGPWMLSITATVNEPGGRAVSVSGEAQVDALARYLGARMLADSFHPGGEVAIDLATVEPAGALAACKDKIEAQLYRETWNNELAFEGGRYEYHSQRKLDLAKEGLLITLDGGRGALRFPAPRAGAYVLAMRDTATGHAISLRLVVNDPAGWVDSISRENPEALEIELMAANAAPATRPATTPSTRPESALVAKAAPAGPARFRIGETAQVVVRSPFAGMLLLSIETDRIVQQRVVALAAGSAVVPIEITSEMRPNAYITATVVRPVRAENAWRAHRAFGVVRLSVDPGSEKLNLAIDAPAQMRPHAQLGAKIRVTDASGNPVADAAVNVAAVDEGILMLTTFPTPDPLAFFNSRRALAVHSSDLYSLLMPETPDGGGKSPGGDGGVENAPSSTSPISARRIKPMVAVSPILHTDAAGYAMVSFDVGQFAGRVRLMAVAAQADRFGAADRAVAVSSPLVLQESLPRFAAPGDLFTATVTLFNTTEKAGEVSVAVELLDAADGAKGLLAFKSAKGARLAVEPFTLAAGGQKTLHVELSAAQACGVARVRFTATLAGDANEQTVDLPIRPASPAITRGGFQFASAGKPLDLDIPGGLLAQTKALDLRVTKVPTLSLPEGLEYLNRYPYGCLEQTTSTCFPLLALRDIGPRIAPGVFSEERVRDKVNEGVIRLLGMQTLDGGLAFWQGGGESWPWGSVYAAHFLVEARQAGFDVPDDLHDNLLSYLKRLLDRNTDSADLVESQAYACFVLALAGQPPRSTMDRLTRLCDAPLTQQNTFNAAERASGRLFLSSAWLLAGRRDRAEALIPALLPQPRQARSRTGNVGSPIRDRALLINTLLRVEPENANLPALVQQLADTGARGEWRSTQDTAFAVMALGRYLRQVKEDKPFDAAELQLDGAIVAQAKAGASLLYSAPPAHGNGLTADAKARVQFSGPADSPAYVSWLQSGVPLAPPAAADNGLKLRRAYFDAAGPLDPKRPLRSGELITVLITLEGANDLGQIVVEDLLPAGLEVENPNIDISAAASLLLRPEEKSTLDKLMEFQTTSVQSRDDRVVAVGTISGGGGRFIYLARAVTPGTYIVPPARAECMYDLTTNSVTESGKLTVLAADDPAAPRIIPANRPPAARAPRAATPPRRSPRSTGRPI